MDIDGVFDESDRFADKLLEVIDLPLIGDSTRVAISNVACSLSLEHWHAVRALLRAALLPSALVVHRAQFESVVRAIWLAHAASNEQVSKLTATLDLESEQAAKNMPQVAEMLRALSKSGPPEAYDAVFRFKENSWKALNSYVHAGIHSLRRHHDGYPIQLIDSILCNANGLAVVSCMHAVVLRGEQPLQRKVAEIAAKHARCMPPPL